MAHTFERRPNLLVATDLDATLLDHQTYSFTAALPALEQLKVHDCPIIFNSSKTQAEQTILREALQIQAPFIIENGAAIVIPPGQLDHPMTSSTDAIKVFGPVYSELVDQLHHLRRSKGYRFRGFADLNATAIADLTGLSVAGATAAQQRSGSEPLCWDDSEDAYADFVATLSELGLQTTQGGRFRHVMGKTDKGSALTWLVERYKAVFPQWDWTVVALGDSPNDLPMLQVADVGVLIPNPARAEFEVTEVCKLMRPQRTGPEGWAEAMAAIVQEYLSSP